MNIETTIAQFVGALVVAAVAHHIGYRRGRESEPDLGKLAKPTCRICGSDDRWSLTEVHTLCEECYRNTFGSGELRKAAGQDEKENA